MKLYISLAKRLLLSLMILVMISPNMVYAQFPSLDVTVIIDGKEKSFKAYNMNNNYCLNIEQFEKIVKETKQLGVIRNTGTEISGYEIDGNNFFKLRDLAKLYDLGLTWSKDNKKIIVDTTVGYDFKVVDEEGNIIEDNVVVRDNPMTVEDFMNVYLYMAQNDIFNYNIEYKNVPFDKLNEQSFTDNVLDAFSIVGAKYPEYFSFSNATSLKIQGSSKQSKLNIVIKSNNYSNEEIVQMKMNLFNQANNVIETLKKQGILKDNMTQREKAKVLYTWIILNTQYDTQFNPISYTGYGQMINGKAVCQGYTSSYNLLCKLVGIKAEGISGVAGIDGTKDKHMWTIAELDGVKVHIDTTWGDPVGETLPSNYINYDYFAVDSQFMKQTHTWDTTIYGGK